VVHGLTGELAGLVAAPDVVVGTSAGSVVATHVAAGTDLDELYAAQWAPAAAEIASPISLVGLLAHFADATAGATDRGEILRRIGTVATGVDDSIADARRAAVTARLPLTTWPSRPLRITAVDVDSGEVAVFDRSSGVALDAAVAASCAIPGVWPVVEIDGRRYMDGGAASMTHATLAAGHERVLIIAALPGDPVGGLPGLDHEVAVLREAGADVTIVGPDADYLAGPGAQPLDPAGRPASASAGDRFARRY
jgi:NTE family protein